MNRTMILVGFLCMSSGCAAGPITSQQAPNRGAAEPATIVLREARHGQELKIAQTLSPDAGALSILFGNLQATADPSGLGGAQLHALVAIPVEGDAGTARISIDARGQTAGQYGDCEIALITPSGAAREWSDSQGSFILNLTADVPVPFVFRVAVVGLCWATKSQSAALLAVDSLDVIIERPSQNAAPAAPSR